VNRNPIQNDALKSSILLRACHQRATLLPRPLGLVEDLNRNKCDLADLSDHWFGWLFEDHSSLLRPLRSLFGEDAAPLFIVGSILFLLGPSGATGHHLNHLVGELTKSATSSATTAATSAAPSWEVVFLSIGLLLDFLFFGLLDGSDDH
jgi:hypothetical protein